MNRIRKIDMTSGSIMRLVVLFALPICAGNILQQLYNTVDTLVIGNFCGTVSLAAVGTSSQPVELLLCIFRVRLRGFYSGIAVYREGKLGYTKGNGIYSYCISLFMCHSYYYIRAVG